MDIASTVAIVLLVGITLWWVLKPLWGGAQEQAKTVPVEEMALIEQEQRRDGLYKTLKSLELDLESGKISTADYEQTRAKLMTEAAAVLQQIDRLSQTVDQSLDAKIDDLLASFQSNGKGRDKNLRKAAQAEIMATATQTDYFVCPNCTHPANADDAFCSRCGTPLTTNCPNCQNTASPGDIFCSHCGHRLAAEVAK